LELESLLELELHAPTTTPKTSEIAAKKISGVFMSESSSKDRSAATLSMFLMLTHSELDSPL
jgi:hypothetical protein